MDTTLLIVAQFEPVMINVPSASKLAPSTTFERLVCHQDVAFVICVTPQDVTTILLLAGHHLYSWPESVLNIEFSMHNLREPSKALHQACTLTQRRCRRISADLFHTNTD